MVASWYIPWISRITKLRFIIPSGNHQRPLVSLLCVRVLWPESIEQLPPLTVNDVRAALSRMKPRAGLGIYRLTPVDFQRLPDEGIQALCDLFLLIEQGLSWPWQSLCIVGKLLGNKSGGDRVIGLIAMLARVWSMAREVEMKE
eukprot:4320662-Pyramimonas_sp.AAC.1